MQINHSSVALQLIDKRVDALQKIPRGESIVCGMSLAVFAHIAASVEFVHA